MEQKVDILSDLGAGLQPVLKFDGRVGSGTNGWCFFCRLLRLQLCVMNGEQIVFQSYLN